MNERVARSLRLQGYLVLLLAQLQGFLIAVPVGKPEAQARSHIEIFLLAFLMILIALTVPSLQLSSRAANVLNGSTAAAVWAGTLHSLLVASLGTTSIHVQGSASAAVEKSIFVLGIITTPFGLTTMGLVLYGLVRSPLRAKD